MDHLLIEVELTGMEKKRGKKSDMRIKEKSVIGRRSDAISRKMRRIAMFTRREWTDMERIKRK